MSLFNTIEWDAPDHVQALYTDALCGNFSTRDPEGKKNWEKLCQHYDLPYSNPTIKQVHGNTVVEAPKYYNYEADAIFTMQKQTPCGVVTADCVPILLCDQYGKWVAAIHAGWRGLEKQVLYACCQKLPNYQKAFAWIGPCISQRHYEVGKEVKQQFDSLAIDYRPFFVPSTRDSSTKKEKRFFVNLQGIAEAQLKHLGICAIFKNTRCTYEDKNLYSFRQSAQTGRIANVIWKNESSLD